MMRLGKRGQPPLSVQADSASSGSKVWVCTVEGKVPAYGCCSGQHPVAGTQGGCIAWYRASAVLRVSMALSIHSWLQALRWSKDDFVPSHFCSGLSLSELVFTESNPLEYSPP